jgi:hypothetical protein
LEVENDDILHVDDGIAGRPWNSWIVDLGSTVFGSIVDNAEDYAILGDPSRFETGQDIHPLKPQPGAGLSIADPPPLLVVDAICGKGFVCVQGEQNSFAFVLSGGFEQEALPIQFIIDGRVIDDDFSARSLLENVKGAIGRPLVRYDGI